jgi:hypothetical protein
MPLPRHPSPPPPPWVYCILGPACGAGRHPSSPVLLSGFSVSQRDISAQTIQLLVAVALNYIGALRHFLHFRRSTASSCHVILAPEAHSSLNSGLARRTSLRSTAASAATTAAVCQA